MTEDGHDDVHHCTRPTTAPNFGPAAPGVDVAQHHLRADPVGAVRQVEDQIEHHLFPSMPSRNLRRFRALVNEFSAGEGVAYTETTVRSSCVRELRYFDSLR
jgi:hypothetical protein